MDFNTWAKEIKGIDVAKLNLNSDVNADDLFGEFSEDEITYFNLLQEYDKEFPRETTDSINSFVVRTEPNEEFFVEDEEILI